MDQKYALSVRRFVLTLSALCLSHAFLSTAQASPKEVSERAQDFNRSFFSKGAPSNLIDKTITSRPGDVRRLMTVLPGALYRGGGPGGKRPLSKSELKGLCEAGFSLAVYGYEEGFKAVSPINCVSKVTGKPNTIEYISGKANRDKFKAVVLKRVRSVILDANKGPVFVHCWNGMHASGEVAAVALRQFCGWSGKSATNYWLKHAGGFPAISRIGKYTPTGDLSIASDLQDVICPQR